MLDFDCFPHLRDMICHYAPPESLLALRCTSRKMRDLCDEKLFHHVKLDISSTGIVRIHPFGSDVSFEWMRLDIYREPYSILGSPEFYRAYLNIETRTSAREQLRKYIQTRMEMAHIVDVSLAAQEPLGSTTYQYAEGPLLRALRSLNGRVRFLNDIGAGTDGPPDFSHLVFRSRHHLARRLRRWTSDLEDLFRLLIGVSLKDVCPHGPRKITVHLLDADKNKAGPAERMWVRSPLGTSLNPTLAECLYSTGYRQCPNKALAPPIQLTVVGGIEQLAHAFGLAPGGTAPAELYAELTARLASARPQFSCPVLHGLRPHVRFITPEGYLAEVGAARVALETRHDPYTGAAAAYLP